MSKISASPTAIILPPDSSAAWSMSNRICSRLRSFTARSSRPTSKLPSPIEWVNKRKLRAKDSVNTVWWFAKTEWPKADITRVLTAYSDRMKKLLADPAAYYTPKKRPSGHDIGTTFAKDNGGAIPPNLLQIPNSESNSAYLRGCKSVQVDAHPARFPAKLPEFFIRLLTDPGDLVVDIFAGSNTTGAVAEAEDRRWLAFDNRLDYLAASSFRFFDEHAGDAELCQSYASIMAGKPVTVAAASHPQLATKPVRPEYRQAQQTTQSMLMLHEPASKLQRRKTKPPSKLKQAS